MKLQIVGATARAALGFCVSLAVVTGCTKVAPETPAAAVRQRPGVHVDAQQLLRVNVIALQPIVIEERELVVARERRAQLDSMLQDAARRELDLDVRFAEQIAPRAGESFFAAAKRHGVDAVLETTLHRFEEREGSAAGVTHAAAVDFSVRLIRVADQRELWSGSFHHADTALTDNLLAARSRGGVAWSDEGKLIQRGFALRLAELSKLRMDQFVRSGVPQQARH